MASWSWRVGEIEILAFEEIPQLLVDAGEFFPGLTIEKQAPWGQPPFACGDQFVLVIQAFVLRGHGRTVLIDACVGAHKARTRPAFDHRGVDWAQQLGPLREEIDTVVLTHLHVDHVGGCTIIGDDGRWEPAFPNAEFLIADAEWEYWRSTEGAGAVLRTGDYLADSIAPLEAAGVLQLIDAHADPAVELLPGVTLRHLPGHTPGLWGVEVSSGGQELLLASDLLHHPVQVTRPELSTRYCVDGAQAAVTRRAVLAEAAERGTLLIPAHFPGGHPYRITQSGGGFVLVDP